MCKSFCLLPLFSRPLPFPVGRFVRTDFMPGEHFLPDLFSPLEKVDGIKAWLLLRAIPHCLLTNRAGSMPPAILAACGALIHGGVM